ncbi:MAG: cupin-like domain-containing protein [Candidatus Binatia bacterium]
MSELHLLPIPRVENLAADEFRRTYLEPNHPVIIKDLASSWPAAKKWTPQYFAREYGSLPVKVYNSSFARAGTSYMSSLRKIPFRGYLDLMMTSSMDLRLFAFNIFWQAPELKQDLLWPDITQGFSKKFIFMFFGCKGSVTPLHYDPDLPYLLHTVLYGKKRVVLFANEESKNLYKHPFNTRSYVDIDEPDFGKFPRLREATGYQAIIHSGETLFMPSGYWHQMIYEEAGYAVCTRCAKLPAARKLRAYVNLLVCFPIDKIMNKLSAESWFKWKEKRARRLSPGKTGDPITTRATFRAR